MMFRLGDLDDNGEAFDFCSGVDSAPWSVVCYTHYADSPRTWTPRFMAPVTNIGVYQSSDIGDINNDGYPDVLVAFDSTTVPGASVLIWLEGPFFPWFLGYRHEIDTTGVKVDNAKLVHLNGDGYLDVLDTEQNFGGTGTGKGLRGLENPC
jgi:hypothetical protein